MKFDFWNSNNFIFSNIDRDKLLYSKLVVYLKIWLWGHSVEIYYSILLAHNKDSYTYFSNIILKGKIYWNNWTKGYSIIKQTLTDKCCINFKYTPNEANK